MSGLDDPAASSSGPAEIVAEGPAPAGPAWPPSVAASAAKDGPKGILGVVALLVTVAAFVGLALLIARVDSVALGAARGLGTAIGAVVGSLLMGALIRWIYLRVTHTPGAVASRWTLLVATVWLAAGFAWSVSAISSEPVLDPSAWLRDASPYVLQTMTADQVEAMYPTGLPTSTEVRQVLSGGTLAGFVVVGAGEGIDADKELADYASSASGGSDPGQRITVGGRPAVLLNAGNASALAFVDGTSYLVAVAAADEATVRSIADALIAHAP